MSYLFTSESVTKGHPDKICDQISDAILDEVIKQDPHGRVACECSITTGFVLVTGEISTSAILDVQKIVRKVIKDIGYKNNKYGFDGDTCGILVAIDKQSEDIALGVDHAADSSEELGAGDQGIMFGYACDETEELMPLPIILAHALTRKLTEVRELGLLPYLGPDGKSQVTVEYDEQGNPSRVDTVVISTQHDENILMSNLKSDIIKMIKSVIPSYLIDDCTKYLINPTGKFVIGGPVGDSGLTGRKIIVDTYGGMARHGGGAFSGKDPTKVDRSASYMARYVAKNLVASGLCSKVELEISYAIGVANPISIYVNSYGTGKLSDSKLSDIIKKEFDFRPRAIISELNLLSPIYQDTASYGHFGRSQFPWEFLNKVNDLKKYL